MIGPLEGKSKLKELKTIRIRSSFSISYDETGNRMQFSGLTCTIIDCINELTIPDNQP